MFQLTFALTLQRVVVIAESKSYAQKYDTFVVKTINLNNQSLNFPLVLKFVSLGTNLNINIIKHIKTDFTSKSAAPTFTPQCQLKVSTQYQYIE